MERIVYKDYSNKRWNSIIEIDYPRDIELAIVDFFDMYKGIKTGYRKAFMMLLDVTPLKSLDEFSDESFFTQIYYLKDSVTSRGLNGIVNFYIYLMEHGYGHFEMLTINHLMYKEFLSNFFNGFSPYVYNPYDNVPNSDKLLIDISAALEESNLKNKRIIPFDATFLSNTNLRNAFKYFYFAYPEEFASKNQKNHYLIEFLIYLDNKYENCEMIQVTLEDLNHYKKMVSEKNMIQRSTSIAFSRVRVFLKFVNGKFGIKFDENQLMFLKNFHVQSVGDLRAYSKEEIDQLQERLEELYLETNFVSYYMVKQMLFLQSRTPMRLSTICGLEIDCVRKLGPNMYCVKGNSKKTYNDTYHITKTIKNMIDEVIEFTSQYRDKASAHVQNLLFIYPKSKGSKNEVLTSVFYSNILNSAARDLGLNQLGSTGVRNFYNTSVTEYAIKSGNGKELISQLSKHSLETHLRFYDNSDVYSLCEQYFDVVIGDLDFHGKIVNDESIEVINTVQDGCGYCRLQHCDNKTMFECFLCANFVTTCNHKSIFEYEIEIIDKLIRDEVNEHEREFLVSKKRLLVAYYASITAVERGEGNEPNSL